MDNGLEINAEDDDEILEAEIDDYLNNDGNRVLEKESGEIVDSKSESDEEIDSRNVSTDSFKEKLQKSFEDLVQNGVQNGVYTRNISSEQNTDEKSDKNNSSGSNNFELIQVYSSLCSAIPVYSCLIIV